MSDLHKPTDASSMIIEILNCIGKGVTTPELLREVVGLLAEWTTFDAVGLRLREGNDYPYFQTRGMSEEFILLENSLCPGNHGANDDRDENGEVALECACGAVLQGRVDRNLPFVTQYGSLWTNSNTLLLKESPELRQSIRGRCVQAGYESSALIPLRFREQTFGLLQFEDRRPGMLSKELLSTLEAISANLALALSQRQYAEQLREEKEKLEQRVRERSRDLLQTNTALMESEERLRLFVQEVHDYAFVILDTKGCVVCWNKGAELINGYRADAIIGHHVTCFYTPEDQARNLPLELLSRARAQGRTEEEMWRVRKDGSRFYANVVVTALQYADGRLRGFSEVTRDVTEHKKAEAARDKQLQRMNLLNEIAKGVLARHDMNSIFNVVLGYLENYSAIDYGCVWSFDPACMKFTLTAIGNKCREFHERIGMAEGVALPPDELGFAEYPERKIIYIPDVANQPGGVCAKWTEVGMGAMLVAPMAVESSLVGVIVLGRREKGAFSDQDLDFIGKVGEHVSVAAHQAYLHESLLNSYEELRRTQEVVLQQERLGALGQMASGIVHDINNALGPIVGYTDMLLEFEAEQLSDTVRSGLEMIRTAGIDIANIAAGMRQFYRKRDEQEILLPIELNQLVRQVIDLTKPRWKDMPLVQGAVIEIETDLQEEMPLFGGLETEIREALTNLIFNAVDAMPLGGKIMLRTYTSGKDMAVLEIRDTGIGMDDETKRRCLEPFFTTKNEKGTGLGLAMVYGVVQRHDGEMEITSELDKGATVCLRFPILESSGPSENDFASKSVPPAMEILCIDDEPVQRRLVKELLEQDGHTVQVADGGAEGLEIFRQAIAVGKPFDVVITDLGMPYVDGRRVAATVKRESLGTPVILLTGWGARMKAEGQMPAEVDYILSKPPMVGKIRKALHKVVNGWSRAKPKSGGANAG
ncbi:MAG: PAS domain S-box protein [Deltaproteobacteria bacterium]|jgi:PAS domain S-box-containing protein|nr:PAS domain S-box protein [Deltaproteobacteria bacterium]